MIVRERSAVPGGDTAAHAALEPRLAQWKENESEAIAAIEQITRDNPTLAHRDSMMSGVIARASELSRTPQMAQRDDSTHR
jgi:hypothetical protein